jgi:hypothetical protein
MQNHRTFLQVFKEKADLEYKVTEMKKNFEEMSRNHESELSHLRSQIERHQAWMDRFEPGTAVPIFTNNQNADFTTQLDAHTQSTLPFGDGEKRTSLVTLVSRESLHSLRPTTQFEPPLSLTTDRV